MRQTKVIVIGAAGNLGRRLVSRGLAHGHEVTAFVRTASNFAAKTGPTDRSPVKVIEGDVLDAQSLSAAVRGHDVVVNTAGHAADGRAFVELFKAVLAVVERELPTPGRFWALAGAAALTIPHYDGVGLPGVPKIYASHKENWQALETSRLDWSLMCPGPMIAAPSGQIRSDLRVSTDIVPYHVPGWAGLAPRLALSLLMKSKLPELIVSYEDVADIMMSNLLPAGRFSRHRVGVALPVGERGRKENWTPGARGGDS